MPEPAVDSNIGLYRSGVTSPERLRHTSVAREHIVDNAIESLRGSVGKNRNTIFCLSGRAESEKPICSRVLKIPSNRMKRSARVSWLSGFRRNRVGHCPSPISLSASAKS